VRSTGKKLSEAARLWALGYLLRDDDAPKKSAADSQAEALAAFGLRLEGAPSPDAPPQRFYLWPENVDAWCVFHACRSDWHVGVAGRTGLDKREVRDEIRRRGMRGQRADRLFEDVRTLEWAALDAWAEQRETEHKD
jgi:hypothetical protein